jgi:hypothetical protein
LLVFITEKSHALKNVEFASFWASGNTSGSLIFLRHDMTFDGLPSANRFSLGL